MKHINKTELQEILESIISCQPVSANVVTIPSMNKTGNPFYGRVTKSSTVNGLIGFFYGNSMNNQLGREGKEANFTPEPRKWGVRNGVLVRHKDKVYVEVKVQSVSETVYRLDGQVIDKAVLGDWVKARTAPHTQNELDKKIILADYNLENIYAIRMLGEQYEIVEHVADAEKIEANEMIIA
jgi:hypothetical protein